MSTRSTVSGPALCVCGLGRGAPVHAVKPPPRWWQRLVGLAWPRWIWGEHAGAHAFLDRSALELTRGQLRRVQREIRRKRRKLEADA